MIPCRLNITFAALLATTIPATAQEPADPHINAGNPLQLEMPDKPGTYVVRYVLRQSRGILAREPIEVR